MFCYRHTKLQGGTEVSLMPAFLPPAPGVTTRVIHNRAKWVVGIDIGSKVVAVARQRSPDLRFEVLDGMDLQVWAHRGVVSPTLHYCFLLYSRHCPPTWHSS